MTRKIDADAFFDGMRFVTSATVKGGGTGGRVEWLERGRDGEGRIG